ncbi:importin-4-like [Drosophila bipectinata]|uniref:importin-4-like n=1 Tax=Drosophila bipectinata TaxID=42026 RepID=UPI0038B31D0A
MGAVLVEIINGLLSSKTDKIRRATAALARALENPEAILGFCNILVSSTQTDIRQYAAVILNKRLSKLGHWQLLGQELQGQIKHMMLQALIAEEAKKVRSSIGQVVGSLVRHEVDKTDSWVSELLEFVFNKCASSESVESELGSTIFCTLADTAPDQFVLQLERVCQLFARVMVAAHSQGHIVTPTISNLVTGMSYLMPVIEGHPEAVNTVAGVMSEILNTVRAFAYTNDVQEFISVFSILESMADHVPRLLKDVRPVLDCCLEVASNKELEEGIRSETITFVARLVLLEEKNVIEQGLLEPILKVSFEMICCSSGDDNEDYYTTDGSSSVLSSALQALDVLAVNTSAEVLMPPLLQILEEALAHHDPIRRRAGFLTLAVMAEGCAATIVKQFLEPMLHTIKSGIICPSALVRNAAFFALGQFAQHLQPDISRYVPDIFPTIFQHLGQLVTEVTMGHPESKLLDRIFYALDTFIKHLKDEVKPHLALLMERLSEALVVQTAPKLCNLALSTIALVAAAAKGEFTPYVPRVVPIILEHMLAEEDHQQNRLKAMEILAIIARFVGKESFMPLTNDTMLFCLSIMEHRAEDRDMLRHAYNLMGAISNVANEEMGAVFPKIMNRILESVLPRSEEDEEMRESSELDEAQPEDDDLVEKEQAIVALKEFAANSGAAFAPYLHPAFDCVLKVVDSPYDSIRKAALEALSQFVIALYKIGDAEGVARASLVVVPKLAQVARVDQEQSVIIAALAALGELLKEVKGGVVPTIELRGIICELIKDLMTIKAACPDGDGNGDDDNEEVEGGDVVMEHAAQFLPLLGLALEPEEFSVYFARLHLQYVQHIPRDPIATDHCYIIYGALADCLQSLGTWIGQYFDHLCSVFIQGTSHPDAHARKKAYYGLGELVLHSERRSFASYPIILQSLSNAIATERNPSALDHIIAALARLLITHMEGVPLGEVLPAFMSYLPLREETRENVSVQKAFRVLFAKARPAVEPYLEQMLVITVQTVLRKELPDSQSTEESVNFIREIVHHYPPFFQKLSSSEECANLMHLL